MSWRSFLRARRSCSSSRARHSLRENTRLLEASRHEAMTDALTGLPNRRKLDRVRAGERRMLALFDLNGFKAYNDTFGHPAGDALLARLAAKLAAGAAPIGVAYRMGGDEFCVLLTASEPELRRVADALSEAGEGFMVTSAYGSALIPDDASTVSAALSVAGRATVRAQGDARRDPARHRARAPAAYAGGTRAGAACPRCGCLVPRGAGRRAARPRRARSWRCCGSPRSCTTSASSQSRTSCCRRRRRSTRPSGASSSRTR
jgi:diguanylate cyclase (GGDEF)-like protein